MFLGTPFLMLFNLIREFSRTKHGGLLAAGLALLFGPENFDARAAGRPIKTLGCSADSHLNQNGGNCASEFELIQNYLRRCIKICLFCNFSQSCAEDSAP